MKTNLSENDWEEMLQKHIDVFKVATAPELSEFNPLGISTHMAERWAKKHSWEFELIPIYIGGGIYLRVFHFTPLRQTALVGEAELDDSIKRNDGGGGKNNSESL